MSDTFTRALTYQMHQPPGVVNRDFLPGSGDTGWKKDGCQITQRAIRERFPMAHMVTMTLECLYYATGTTSHVYRLLTRRGRS